jgi:hypothetical protein
MRTSELIQQLAEQIVESGDRDLDFVLLSSCGDEYAISLEDVRAGNYRHRNETVLGFSASESLQYFEEADE